MNICYDVSTRKMVSLAKDYVNKKLGVFLVARNKNHQDELYSLFLKSGIKSSDIFLIDKNKSIFLTDDSVKNGDKDYKIVITTLRKAEGYTLTRLKVMITSVYPSNNATRTQLEGRINRLSSKPGSTIYYHTIHCGILTHILKYHNEAKNLQQVLRTLATEI